MSKKEGVGPDHRQGPSSISTSQFVTSIAQGQKNRAPKRTTEKIGEEKKNKTQAKTRDQDRRRKQQYKSGKGRKSLETFKKTEKETNESC